MSTQPVATSDTSHDNDTLLCLFLHGPTWDGDVPSKSERDDLYEAGLIKRGQGFQWLTDAGVAYALAHGYESKQRKHQAKRHKLHHSRDELLAALNDIARAVYHEAALRIAEEAIAKATEVRS